MSQMVEVMIDSIRVSLTSQQRIVLLRRMDEERFLPIWIGPFEAEAITIALQEIEMARPQTHDLILQTIAQMQARLTRVEIVSLQEDVFYGNLIIEQEGKILQIDSRPSDSIALAVRAHVPILVASEIFELAGISVEPDIQVEANDADESTTEPPMPDSEVKKRLSVYEDFLQNLNMDDRDDKPGEEDDTPSPDEPEPPDLPDDK
jgi:bifunctional DNase/RNase